MTNCKNCNHQIVDEFCSKCGQPKNIKRIDFKYMVHEIEHLLHFEKGFHFTAWNLIIKPGKTIRTYLFENRNKYVKPIVYLFFASLIFTLFTSFLHIKYTYLNVGYIEPLKDKVNLKTIDNWLISHIAYTNIIVGFCIAPWLVLLYKNRKHNVFEMIVVMSYVLATGLLLLLPLLALTKITTIFTNFTIFFLLYQIWAIGQFFGEKKILNYLKALLAFILGILTHVAIFFVIGYINKFYM
ncbi:DUF3667 domain-containing protein [Flavobacterium sp. SUN052]|uniref:DUF3667 domain-containing protein n=1 Tax=Flavobacterium sp. SUN052 TaxID=3002441 RepID=UPI00237E3B6E|nr:DUF3667 domain-containing protein [Flavobacterium sp. SUN052]MEC4003431.1 DUF3667 domain-containing protein [Flavobacterium sp. SUN052]